MEPIPGDRVMPLHFFEDSLLVQGNNMAVSLVFDAVLDPERLRESLEGLVRQEGWQRLGGRLRKNPKDQEYPSSISTMGCLLLHTRQPSRIPKPQDRPCVVGDPDDLEGLAWEPGYKPNGINDYLTSDLPVLGLRVNSFIDKTVVVLQWQHVAFDALGMQYVVEGWSSMLWGKTAEVLIPCGLDSDSFLSLAQGSRPMMEEHVLTDRRVGWGGLLRWGLGYGVDMLVRAKENRLVCIPETYWQPQWEKAVEELRDEAVANGEHPSKVFLTGNDVLTAWILRCVLGEIGMSPERTVAASIAMSLRKSFEGDLLPASTKRPYVGNAFGWANVLITAGDVNSKPLSWLAWQVRGAINKKGTRAQHEAYYAMVRTSGTGMVSLSSGRTKGGITGPPHVR
ncbi:hypothetical protein N7491_002147 [Penicillium cf. griseofulvum]|nr:hypothetical protein N7491_002147 [Penicillium cf. griseofulvum]